MSMLDNQSKIMLVENMRKSLAKSVLGNKTLNESAQAEGLNFIAEQATWEQLLNLTMNPLRESKYLPAHVLEGAVAIVSSAMMTQRKVIGPNAITEGAIRLQKKTGAVVTESMLDAALELAKGNGLHVVANTLKEAFEIEHKKALAEAAKVTLSAKGKALAESVIASEDAQIVTEGLKDIASKAIGLNNIKNAKAAREAGKRAKKVVTDATKRLKELSAKGRDKMTAAEKAEFAKLNKLRKDKGVLDRVAGSGKTFKKEVGKAALKIGTGTAAAAGGSYGAYKGIKKWRAKKTGEEKTEE